MLWILVIVPTAAYAANGDEVVSGVGFIILSTATLIYRYKKYTNMNDKIESALSVKQSIAVLFAGGAASLTATNVISLFGMVLTAIGLVFVFLNWLENRRRNNLSEREFLWKKEQQEAEKRRTKLVGRLKGVRKVSESAKPTGVNGANRPQ